MRADVLVCRVGHSCVDEAREQIADIQIVEFDDTSHDCFLDREADVIEAMKRLL